MDQPQTYTITYVVTDQYGSATYDNFTWAYDDYLKRTGQVSLEQVTNKLILEKQ